MIKNIFFDLDETLLDFKTAERGAIQRVFSAIGISVTEELLARYSVINQEQWRLLEEQKLTRQEVLIRRFALLFEEYHIDHDPNEAQAMYLQELGVGHFFIEGAEELLDTLSKSYQLYLASNGNTSVQYRRIESASIGKYFRNIFISEELGADKPSGEFFEQCASHIEGFRPEETVMIGDSLSSDMKGGIDFGMHTIWYNPKRLDSGDIHPEKTVASLQEIPEVIASLS